MASRDRVGQSEKSKINLARSATGRSFSKAREGSKPAARFFARLATRAIILTRSEKNVVYLLKNTLWFLNS